MRTQGLSCMQGKAVRGGLRPQALTQGMRRHLLRWRPSSLHRKMCLLGCSLLTRRRPCESFVSTILIIATGQIKRTMGWQEPAVSTWLCDAA